MKSHTHTQPNSNPNPQVNMRMHHGMAIRFSGDVATDFVRGMIPHHQGALDMCEVLVEKLSIFLTSVTTNCSNHCGHSSPPIGDMILKGLQS